METIERVNMLLQSHLEQNDIELVETIYRREQGGMVLRLLVDKKGGISLNECEALNNYASELLDKEDFIEERYTLEVSSPGLDRPIVTDRDFERVMGRELEINTYEPVDGRKYFEGRIVGMDSDTIVVESGGIAAVIPRSKIAMARLRLDI